MRGKHLGSIFNNDINNILVALDGGAARPEEYRRVVEVILDMQPGVLAQNVGMPDPVIYRSEVATQWDTHLVKMSGQVWEGDAARAIATREAGVMRNLLDAGTDPLTITIDVCRQRSVPIVASYRMNAEDWYAHTEFGRAHPEWRIPLSDSEWTGAPSAGCRLMTPTARRWRSTSTISAPRCCGPTRTARTASAPTTGTATCAMPACRISGAMRRLEREIGCRADIYLSAAARSGGDSRVSGPTVGGAEASVTDSSVHGKGQCSATGVSENYQSRVH